MARHALARFGIRTHRPSPTPQRGIWRRVIAAVLVAASLALRAASARAQDATDFQPREQQKWNIHLQNTDIIQYHPSIHAPYSGPNSLRQSHETKQTISLDVLLGTRLWPGAEVHFDGLMWQGFGFSNSVGIDGFPNGEAFRLGTERPNGAVTRLFVRQTIGLGGEQEDVADGPLALAGTQDISRVVITLGRMSAKDIFDNNAYANDPRTQFMSWALMANQAWDYPADSIGYTTGLAAEWNRPQSALRYGFFQVPSVSNGLTAEDLIFKYPQDRSAASGPFVQAWGMVLEGERRYAVNGHPGAVRLLAYLNRAHMGSYQAAIDSPVRPADIKATRDYRTKYGFGLNVEQEVATSVAVFSRLGWSDGRNEAWVFSDVDYTANAGISIKGEAWHRPDDTFGLAGVLNGISRVHQHFFDAGGLGILAGDGHLSYGTEAIVETYYDVQITNHVHAALDYQFVTDPGFNRDRGPVHVFGARLHWEC